MKGEAAPFRCLGRLEGIKSSCWYLLVDQLNQFMQINCSRAFKGKLVPLGWFRRKHKRERSIAKFSLSNKKLSLRFFVSKKENFTRFV